MPVQLWLVFIFFSELWPFDCFGVVVFFAYFV